MRRREFIALIGGATIGWPLAANAQQPTMPVIGFLGTAAPGLWADRLLAFREGLGETSYVEGKNVTIEYRWAEGQYDNLPALAADLVRGQVNVLVTAATTSAALAAKSATTTIPTVFLLGADPVEIGLAASLNRPGGNMTGTTVLSIDLAGKRLEILREILPATSTIAVMLNPNSPTGELESRDMQLAAHSLGLQIKVLRARIEREIEVAFETLVQLRAGGLVIGADALFSSQWERIAALSFRYRVPTIHSFRDFVAAGGLMSYGANNLDAWRQTGVYTGRILKGEKPADLPIHQSRKVALIINLKTAKALGLTVPPSLLARADEVIE